MMKYFAIMLLFAPALLFAESGSYYAFEPPWDDTVLAGSFLPRINTERAGEKGFLRTDNDGNFIFDDNKPVRFAGVNFSFGASISDSAHISKIACKLAKFGFNVVRMHHLDNYAYWNQDETIFDVATDVPTTRVLSPVSLRKLGFTIKTLADNGIYTNLNLHVSREFQAGDEVPLWDSLPAQSKTVSIFDPTIRQRMKEYAVSILDYVNPYTGLRIADDPALAFVEISNENSLYRAWHWNTVNYRSGSQDISFYHSAMLDSMWMKFLRRKYADDKALKSAWSINTDKDTTNLVVNGDFSSEPGDEWYLEVHNGNSAKFERDMSIGNPRAKITVAEASGTSWEIQFKQVARIKIKKDSLYKVSFTAYTDVPGFPISVGMMKDIADWDSYGLSYYAELTDNPSKYTAVFRAGADDSVNTRLTFSLGRQKGIVYFDDIRFESFVPGSLDEGESLPGGTVRRIRADETSAYSNARTSDITEFYLELQKDFFDDMRNYLKDTVGVKCPVTGTGWFIGLGDLYTQIGMDYIDNHYYWQHPIFPGTPWSSTDWYIPNTPILLDTTRDFHAYIPSYRMNHKPGVISEYNHPFPNSYKCEFPIFLTAYSSMQNFGAYYVYAFHHNSTDWERDHVTNWFDIDADPSVMSLMAVMNKSFRYYDAESEPAAVVMNFRLSDVFNEFKETYGGYFMTDIDPMHSAVRGVRIGSLSGSATSKSSDFNQANPVNPYISDNREICWDNKKGLLSISSPKTCAVSGYVNDEQAGDLRIKNLSPGNFFSVVLSSVETGKSVLTADTLLLCIAGSAQNTSMVWNGTTTINDNWGTAPSLLPVQNVECGFGIGDNTSKVLLIPLTNRFTAANAVEIPVEGTSNLTLTIDQNNKDYQTPMFAVVKVKSVSVEDGQDTKSAINITANGACPSVMIASPVGETKIRIVDLTGVIVREDTCSQGESKLFDTNFLASGVYCIQAIRQNAFETKKLVVAR